MYIHIHICICVVVPTHNIQTLKRGNHKLLAVQTQHYLISHTAVVEQRSSTAEKDKYKLIREKMYVCTFKELCKAPVFNCLS